LLLNNRSVDQHLFFDLDYIASENAEIILHKPTVVDNVYDFGGNKYCHYMSTLDIGGVAHVFFRRMNGSLLSSYQSTMLITSVDGVTFSDPVEVFDIHPQCHNFFPFKDNGLKAIGGGHSGDLNLYNSEDSGFSWTFERKLLDGCVGDDICFDSLNVMVDGNIYGRQWNGNDREVHLYRGNGYNFHRADHVKIETDLRQLYTSGIFKYASDMYVGVPMLFQGEDVPSFTKVMYSRDGVSFVNFAEVWFADPSAVHARSGYVAPGIFKTETDWFMYGIKNYGTSDISLSVLKLRPYGLASAWSQDGFLQLPDLDCAACYVNMKGYYKGMYVDSLKHKVLCSEKLHLNDTHIFRFFCDEPSYSVYVIQRGNLGVVILLAGSYETVLSDEYYQSIGPYMSGYTVITYSLPFGSSLEEWSSRDMLDVVSLNNKLIDAIVSDYPGRPLILSGISRGGYLAAMYPNADSYYLFSPVMDWNQLSEWEGKNRSPPLPTFFPEKSYYVYSSTNDDRVNGGLVIDYVSSECSWCVLKIGNSGHSVPVSIFMDAVS